MSKTLRTFIGARFANPAIGYLANVGKDDDGDIYLNLDDERITSLENDKSTSFRTNGLVITPEELYAQDFVPVLPIQPQVGDKVVVRNSKSVNPSSKHVNFWGHVVAVEGDHVGVQHHSRDVVGIADLKDVLVVKAKPRLIDFELGSNAVIIARDLNNVAPIGAVVEIVEVSPSLLSVLWENGDTSIEFPVPRSVLAPYKEWDVRADLLEVAEPASAPVPEAPKPTPIIDLFQASFVPANSTLGFSLEDAPVGAVFSTSELEFLIAARQSEDDPLAANMLGIAILNGRQVPVEALRIIMSEEIPYGLSSLITDPVEFFKEIGRIATDQSAEIVRRFTEALAAGVDTGTLDLDFADPSEIAFTRMTGINPKDGVPKVEQPQAEDVLYSFADLETAVFEQFLSERVADGQFEGEITDPALIKILTSKGYDSSNGPLTFQITKIGEAPTDTDVQDNLFSEILEAINGAQGFVNESSGGVLPPIDEKIKETLFDLKAADAVENGGARSKDFDGLLTDTLGELKTLGKIGKADAKLLSHDLTGHTDATIANLEALLAHVANISANVGELSDYTANERAEALLRSTKGRLKSMCNNLEAIAKTATEIQKLVVPARALAEGFDAIVADVTALEGLKP